MFKGMLIAIPVLAGIGLIFWVATSDRDPNESAAGSQMQLATANTAKVPVVSASDSQEEGEVRRSARHAAGALQKTRIGSLQKKQSTIRKQIECLDTYKDDKLRIYAVELDLPDNPVRAVVPNYFEAKREIAALKISGLGDKHPAMVAKAGEFDEMKLQIDEVVTHLRARLKERLNLVSEQLK
jgi:hypothetical protein